MAYVNRANPLSWGFISFLCKPRNISFYSFLSHSLISFIHSPMSSILRVSLDSAEAGPRHIPAMKKCSGESFVIVFPVAPKMAQVQGEKALEQEVRTE